jgi:hypothetical protein
MWLQSADSTPLHADTPQPFNDGYRLCALFDYSSHIAEHRLGSLAAERRDVLPL